MGETFETLQEIINRLGERLFGARYDTLTEPEMTFRLVWGTTGDIDNGGFFQHIGNADETILQAPAAFRRIRAIRKAEAVEAMLAMLGPLVDWASQESKDEAVLRLEERLVDKYDQVFIHESEDVKVLLLQFVADHHDAFYPVN